jgi:poly-gamma-glutamate capsule biosynthesis protein CapA/YwtB (metallophosphatase superfamily)
MSHQDVLQRARQGNEEAITQILQQVLARDVQVKVRQQAGCLQIFLQEGTVPDRRLYSRILYAAVVCLGIASVRSIRLHGYRVGKQQPEWVQGFVLGDRSVGRQSRQSVATQPVAPTVIPVPPTVIPVPPTVIPVPPTVIPVPPTVLQPKLSSAAPHPNILLLLPTVLVSFAMGAGLTYLKPQHSAFQASTQMVLMPNDSASTPLQKASPGFSALPLAAPQQDESLITIKAVGDMILGTNFPGDRLPPNDGQFLFSEVKPFLGGADLLFGNFESTLTDYPYSAKDMSRGMTFAFRTPPAYAAVLKDAGFQVLSVANNHSLDFGDQGFLDTIAHLQQTGMQTVGQKGQITYTDVKGVKLAFIGFSYLPDHNSMHDLEIAKQLVTEAKQNAQIVIISVHAGAEGTDEIHTRDRTETFFGEDRGNMVLFSHTLIDQGADLILGHGPHVARSLELYKGKLVAYSLGNFMGYRTLSTEGMLGTSLILQAQLDRQGKFVSGRIIPVALDADGVPYIDDYFQSVVLIRNLIESDFPVTPLLIDDLGYILKNER